MPPLVYPTTLTYSRNRYGIALLGRIIQEITGIPLDVYIKEKILMPIGMKDTFFLTNMTAESLRAFKSEPSVEKPMPHLLIPYTLNSKSGSFDAGHWAFSSIHGVASTVSDMTLLMKTLLKKRRYQQCK